MKKTKNDYLWFFGGVLMCCVNAFLYGEIGGALYAIATVIGFISYSMIAVGIYKQRKYKLLPKN